MRTREENREYYHAHIETRRADSRRWYAKNKKKLAAAKRAQRVANPEKFRAACRKWRLKNPGRQKSVAHGLTHNEILARLETQGGVCRICGTTEPKGNGWNGDHDHASGNFRGVLCHHCNLGLGHFQDDPSRMRRAIEYVERHAELGELF